MLDQLQERADKAVELALSSGADDAFGWASWSRSVKFKYRDGKLEEVKESTSRSLQVE
ncbi:MAG: TldD/PmbA family protein, partial [Proteobacteria bacterium]|nr:TldD/PmbA family protein [Pseudomonadota bacterium]